MLKWLRERFSKKHNLPSEKEILQQQSALLLEQFKHSSTGEVPLTIFQESKTPHALFSSSPTKYQKEIIYFPQATHYSEPSEKPRVEVLHKDGKPNCCLWHVTPEMADNAVRWGAYKPQALTSLAIATLGKYRVKVAERALGRHSNQGIVSNRFGHAGGPKLVLLECMQDRIAILQNLECLSNSYDQTLSPTQNFAKVVKVINQTLSNYRSLMHKVLKALDACGIDALDSEAKKKIKQWIIEDHKLLVEIKKNLYSTRNKEKFLKEELLQVNSLNSIQVFIQDRVNKIVEQGQAVNESITFSSNKIAFSRGDLNSVIEDAKLVVDRYKPSQHHKVMPQDQGKLAPGKNGLVMLDSSKISHSASSYRQLAVAMSFATGADQIKMTDSGPILQSFDPTAQTYKSQNLLMTGATKWLSNGTDWKTLIKKAVIWPFSLVAKMTGSALEILSSIFPVFTSVVEKLKFSQWFQMPFDWLVPQSPERFTFSQLMYKKMNIQHKQLGFRIRQGFKDGISSIIWDLKQGLSGLPRKIHINVLAAISNDWRTGFWRYSKLPESEVETLLQRLDAELSVYLKDYQQRLDDIEAKRKRQFGTTQTTSTGVQSGNMWPSRPLADPEFCDLLNAGANGLEALVDLYTDIMRKHPALGVTFLASYVLGIVAVLKPAIAQSIVGKDYTYFLQKLGELSAQKGTMSAALGGGVYHSQIAIAIQDLIMCGPDSYLVHGAKALHSDPTTITAAILFAVAFGRLIEHLPLAFITEALKHEAKESLFPDSVYAYAGGKIALLIVELLEVSHLPKHQRQNVIKERLKAIGAELEIKSGGSISAEKFASEHHIGTIDELLRAYNLIKGNYVSSVKTDLLLRLVYYQEHIHNLDLLTRYQLYTLIQENFTSEESKMLKQILFPQQQRSVVGNSLALIFNYLAISSRCVASAVTWNLEPWRLLRDNVLYDSARIIFSLRKIVKIVSSTLITGARLFIRVPRKLFSWVYGKFYSTNNFAYKTYAHSQKIEKGYHHLELVAAKPSEALKKHVTSPHVSTYIDSCPELLVFSSGAREFTKPSKRPVQEKVTEIGVMPCYAAAASKRFRK